MKINGQAVLTGILTFLAQIYHYSAFYYGSPSRLVGSLDPIGVGIPSRVKFSCTPEQASLLKNLGMRMNKNNVSEELYLIDETDTHYIVAFEALPNENMHTGTIKIDKSLIKVILFTGNKTG